MRGKFSKKQIAYVSLFEQAVKNIKKALEELSSQSDDYKFKVERILKVK